MEIDDTKFVSLIREKIPNLIDTTVEKVTKIRLLRMQI